MISKSTPQPPTAEPGQTNEQGRAADVPTNGVAKIKTKGSADHATTPPALPDAGLDSQKGGV